MDADHCQNAPHATFQVRLASSSPYRRALLERLGLAFEVDVPGIDESRGPGESPQALVARLATEKARAVSARTGSNCLIIGSDQVAVLGGDVLGKPGNFEANVEQLTHASEREVTFLTGLCVLNTTTDRLQVDVVPFSVRFRRLSEAQIRAYVAAEQPFDCAGGFKSEGLGIALFDSMCGEDATALIGLPLIRLTGMLRHEGLDVLYRNPHSC